MLFSAELVLEEKIEYNDLVKSIQDETSSNDDEHSNVQTIQADKQNDVAPKNGKCKLKAKNSVWNIYFILNIKDFHILTLEHVLFGGIIYLFINLWKQNHLSATSFILILFSCFPSVDIFSSVVFFFLLSFTCIDCFFTACHFFINWFSDAGPKLGTEDRGDPNDPRVRLKRDCVGILAAFKFKDPSHHVLIVANTHIYW